MRQSQDSSVGVVSFQRLKIDTGFSYRIPDEQGEASDDMSHANLQLLEHAASIQPTTATTSAPSLDPLVTGNFVVKLGPLMRAPREIRDKIYRFLLLTKHTKVHLRDPVMEMYECYQPHMVSSAFFQ